ncbi:HNH endonuclease [Brevibacillus laterosporus]|uniref:HNH endonuclease n=1 Tax=Brevibacillus laterosporus TaxID=1465 RepID=UPI000E6D18D6|nr:HNH endonuclease [Brevibacillus laterosporus]AYB38557.1 HNH endonuclease [Brevibacillus laterosporus]MBM7110742.1 hypothetical protein [Brevibacillus laterosporus]
MGLFDEVRAVQKPNFKRRTKKRVARGRISPAVYNEVMERDQGRCVLCGKTTWLEAHHIIFRSAGGTGEAYNVALACGPVTQTGTCHWKAHNTESGRKAFEEYRQKVLIPYYWGGAS